HQQEQDHVLAEQLAAGLDGLEGRSRLHGPTIAERASSPQHAATRPDKVGSRLLMARHLCIVARDNSPLYGFLTIAYRERPAGEDTLDVGLDRRGGGGGGGSAHPPSSAD